MTDYKNIRDRRYRRGELSSRFPNISEEEQFRKEVIGEIAVWHTPEEVYEVYQWKHQQGETVEAILSSIKSSEIRQREAVDRQSEIIGGLSDLQKQSEEKQKEFDKDYRELGRGIERMELDVNEALRIIEDKPLIFYNKDGIRITENDMERIFREYFRGTDLENIKYNWKEILNPEYLVDVIELYKISKKGAEKHEIIQLLTRIANKLDNSIESIEDTKRKKAQRAIKENDIRIWVLSVGVNKLKGNILSDPKRVSINYKIDKGETALVLTELNHRINRQFRTNFTPIDWIPWMAVGMVGLVSLGLWLKNQRRGGR